MSGSWFSAPPRRIRRGAALTLVFASVLVTGAATGSWGDEARRPPGTGADTTDAASRATGRLALDGGVPDRAGDGPRGGEAHGGPEGYRGGRRHGAGDRTSGDAAELVSRSGDRWSAAYSAREYEGVRQDLDGTYVGVGISVRQVHGKAGGDRVPRRRDADRADRGTDGTGPRAAGAREAAEPSVVEVDRVEPDSPAARAGVRPGDRLRTVGGRKVTGLPVTEVVTRLRGSRTGDAEPGRPGSEVTVGLRRGSNEWQRTLVRTRLASEPVSVDQLGSGVTRIKVSSFTKGTGKRVRDAVAQQAPKDAGIVLDLRGNAGGLVDESVAAASAFLDGGLVATYDDRGTQRALYAAEGVGDTDRPVVVLVDGGTMSAAELLTGALQDRGRAVVVGSRTFGKGTVQVPSRMADGSVAELTVGRYTTPAGRDVEGEGIAPDLSVDSRSKATDRARTVLSGLEARS
ncbi:S41 family peptidase [Streptomyces boncukensis]|uniref:PDZ domain-containing protein n=1 Tax=Streptomyces boncukensis TaxID=2711219 RepID=A0A6G4WUH8_9ACTN|nr:S41 family peptidase [Streptomyces boncukensis]NGO68502.1 PDZ domain-containing protein [Streptomyces boncukensis]